MSYQQQPPMSQPGMPGMSQPGPSSGGAMLDVHSKFHPLAFILFLTGPGLAVDGQEMKLKWGQQQVPIAPGQHHVEMWTRYITKMGSATLPVNVMPGQTVPLFYAAPTIMFLKGALAHQPVKVPGGMFTTIMIVVSILLIVLACLIPVLFSLAS